MTIKRGLSDYFHEKLLSLLTNKHFSIIAAKNTSQRGMLQERCRNVTSATLNIAGNVAATFLQRSYVRLSATFRMLQERCTEHCRNVAGTLQECCRKFCSGMCILSIVLWLMGRTINGVLFTYIICMSILLGPVLLFKIPKNIFLRKAEWDSGIDEFLPAVTVDSLKILERAGDMGDRSPTPPSESSDNQIACSQCFSIVKKLDFFGPLSFIASIKSHPKRIT
ncbi:hypothetical protein PV328_007755 [Microctonus aethiopoides]|uniref:Uncharacterized protein n=1 Tax=Microctonus aethiopoides TaxID=144406 RepID=A0AA39C9E4_9HYME|nr:hypothetical protein PV328_007755 [Microctonus aethiopoides]